MRNFGHLGLILIGLVSLIGVTSNATAQNQAKDFNGDGFSDLVVGVPAESFEAANNAVILNAGVVHVLYGSSGGVGSAGNQQWHQNSPGIADTVEALDFFGSAVAIGDFNADGFCDLVIGVRSEFSGASTYGAVHVLYGSVSGLQATGSQLRYGPAFAFAVGDFNGDGYSDLAVGTKEPPGEPLNAGAVKIWYGSATGLTSIGSQLWSQNSPGIGDTSESSDGFGKTLIAGDFNGDTYLDLAVGVPGEDSGAGAVHIIYGSASGLVASGSQVWRQGSAGLLGISEAQDWFGEALAQGDFNGDGYSDLAVGVPGEDIDSPNIADAGVVQILYGSASGLRGSGNQIWSQNTANIPGIAEANDRFASSLAAGDFDGDGLADLAIGVPGEGFETIEAPGAGAVHILYGTRSGLTAARNQFWHQDVPGMLGVLEAGDGFGAALTAADYNGDHYADLAVGIPFEDIGSSPKIINAGAVQIIYGSASGLRASGNQIWDQDSAGITGIAELQDQFGLILQ